MTLVIPRDVTRQSLTSLDMALDSVDTNPSAGAQVADAMASVRHHVSFALCYDVPFSESSGYSFGVRDYGVRSQVVNGVDDGMRALATLVTGIRSGDVPVPSEDLVVSADRALDALERQNVSVDEWARQLAEDVSHLAD